MEFSVGLQEDPGYILLADKNETRRKKTAGWLKRAGLNILEAKGKVSATKVIETTPIACILCDWNLRSILKEIKDKKPYRMLFCPKKNLVKALKLKENADRLLPLPLQKKEWVHACQEALDRYKFTREKAILEHLIHTQHKKLQEAMKSLENELKLGAKIQETLLAGKIPKVPQGIKIEALSIASKEIDGDFYTFYRPTDSICDIAIGDVMGKGIASALVATKIIAELARFADPLARIYAIKPGLNWHEPLLEPESILTHVHRLSSKEIMALQYFVTLFYGRFDFQKKLFSYIDCGHAKPILKRGDKIFFLEGTNFPLGVVEKESFKNRSLSFKKGDLFLFYSDGVTEARSNNKEHFGIDRLVNLVKREKKDHIKKIREAIYQFTQKKTLDDDITLITVEIESLPSLIQNKKETDHFKATLDSLDALRKSIKAKITSSELQTRVMIALNEVFCNAVTHGKAKGDITLNWEIKDDTLTIEVKDNGISFAPEYLNSSSPDGGYGWKLIEKTADEVIYFQKTDKAGQNRLRLYFNKRKGEL